MAKETTKTKQIGVRFNKDLLEGIILAGIADSPQRVLNFYEKSYLELIELRIAINNQPENKERIEAERKGDDIEKVAENPITFDEAELPPVKQSKLSEMMLKNREKFLNK